MSFYEFTDEVKMKEIIDNNIINKSAVMIEWTENTKPVDFLGEVL